MTNDGSNPVVKLAKYLGIHIDKLNFEDHIKYIETKVTSSIGIMSKVKPFVPMNVLKYVDFTFVHSHLQYGLIIWSATTRRISLNCKEFKIKR